MGANIATNVANGDFVETTLGYTNEESIKLIKPLFHYENFLVQTVREVAGVELCGALKNIVAMAAGFCLGLNYGASTYAGILRIGFQEMRSFIKMFFPKVDQEIFFLSCGLADLICTCRGGRNSRVSKAFVEKKCKSSDWTQLEKDMLKGQKLAGLLTCEEVYAILKARDIRAKFPLFTRKFFFLH